ncbi:MAG: hypothetical protein RPR28_07810 [Cycloclasticus sp.]
MTMTEKKYYEIYAAAEAPYIKTHEYGGKCIRKTFRQSVTMALEIGQNVLAFFDASAIEFENAELLFRFINDMEVSEEIRSYQAESLASAPIYIRCVHDYTELWRDAAEMNAVKSVGFNEYMYSLTDLLAHLIDNVPNSDKVSHGMY